MFDVEPARRDVRRYEDVEGTVAETVHDAVALVLRHAAVQRCSVVAVAGELLGKILDFAARPGEDQRRGRVFEVEDAPERGRLVRAANDVGDLPHAGGGAALLRLRLDRDPDRLVEVALGDAGDLRRDRRGEEGRLTRGRDRGQHRIEVLGEAHVEHLVGFVEHDELDGIEVQAAPRQMVDGAARRRDDEVDTAAQAAQLLADRLPAVHRQHADARRAPARWIASATCIASLRRHEDEPANPSVATIVPGDSADRWKREGRRLACARRRFGENVVSSRSGGIACRWTGVGSS